MIQAIAIDDEPHALKVIEEHCSKIDFLTLQKSFTNPIDGLDYLSQKKIPVLFLDIKMHNISGLELSKILPSDTHIIFTTAYPDFAVDGFEINAIDYLLKPISFSRFLKSCHRLKSRFNPAQTEKVYIIKDGKSISRVKTSEIFYLEAFGNYLKLQTTFGLLVYRQTMLKFLNEEADENLCRIHKSFIINIEHISRIETHQLTVDNQKLPLSPNFRADLWTKLGLHNQ